MQGLGQPPAPVGRATAGMPYPFDRPDFRDRPDYAGLVFLPAWYTVSIQLGHEAGNNQRGAVQLRPEPFVLYRICWATNGDVPPIVEGLESSVPSAQGRCVEVTFKDEYTEFVTQPTLLSALFGDSNGFLDIPQGLQLRGKQTISVFLNRINFPGIPPQEPEYSRFDFCFQGVGLLKPGMGASGSAG